MPELTVPDPPTPPVMMQVPVESRKQPLASWMPLPNVEVAVVEITFSRSVWRAPVSTVDVPATVETMFPPVIFNPLVEERPAVVMPPEKVEDAVEVEMILKIVEVPYTVMGPAMVVEPCTERGVPGVEVPMPKKLLVVSTVRKFAESSVVAPE